MMDRRQFASRTASAWLALQTRGLLAARSGLAPAAAGRPGTFRLKDYLGVYEFPEQLVSYPVVFDRPVLKNNLRLVQKGKSMSPFQLTAVEGKNGRIAKAVVHFRTNLKMDEEKEFALIEDPKSPQGTASPITLEKRPDGQVVIQANQLQVMVPGSDQKVLNVPVTQAPAPLLALSREPGQWVGHGRLEGPADLLVERMQTKVVEHGPLFVIYQVTYSFSSQREYSVELKVQWNESHVEISESATGLGPDDHLAFRFSYKEGVDPNGRLLMANGGYSTGGSQQGASGAYDQGVNPRGMLPVKLGIYTPNSINLPRSIAFWNDAGANAILFTLFRLPEWKTSQRALWTASNLPDNLAFYSEPNGGDKFVRAAIVGRARYWAISLIARSEMVVRGIQMGDWGKTPRPKELTWTAASSMQGMLRYGGGPDVRLLMRLNDFSLNRYKDMVFEFPEEATPNFALPDAEPEAMTGPEFMKQWRRSYGFLGQVGWDYSGDLGANHWGWSMQPQSVTYAFNASKWSQEDRVRARSWLVFAAYTLELDTAMPHSSMLGGHPNFAAEYKQILGIAAGLFPRHPDAQRWRDTYLKFWAEYTDRYIRKADVATGAKGGRFVESIACYNYASMEAVTNAATGFKLLDGTQILDRPEVRSWVRWDMESRLPFRVDGARVVPSEGAHAAVLLLGPGGRWHKVAHGMARLLRDTAPQLADEWLWSMTAGAEGKKPALQSSLFFDYGPVMRYDFGGPSEAYLQLQQLDGSNYRWGGASNGALYYVAKGKVWSWNQAETNGDGFDLTKLPAFQVGNSSLGAAPADSVLYDFGFAQYYRAKGAPLKGPKGYVARSVIMVRGDYLAVYDQVQGGAEGTFHWGNVTSGLRWQVFNDAAFTQPLRTFINDARFPGKISPDEVKDFRLPNGSFGIRGTGELLVPAAGKYKIRTSWQPQNKDVPAGDSIRLFLDDHKIFDGRGPATVEIEFEARAYTIHFDYSHAGKEPPFFNLSWGQPGKTNFDVPDSGAYRSDSPMPFIAEIKGSAGNQVHIVSPEKVEVAALSTGGVSIAKEEFVFFSDESKELTQNGLNFSGKVGYARAGEVALFEGTHLELNGLGLSRDEGDFGASIKQMGATVLEGRIAGKRGGTLHVHLPLNFSTQGLKVAVDGKSVPVTAEKSSISFPVTIAQADGIKAFRITA